MTAPEMFNLANRNLMSERSTFRVRLTTAPSTKSTNGSGVVSDYVLVDPSGTTYTEIADSKGLYSMYRLIAAKLTVTPVSGNTAISSVWFASLLSTGIGVPSSLSQVTDNANVVCWSYPTYDNTGRPRTIYLGGDLKLNFQEWGTSATDDAGAPGGFYFYGSGFSNSQPLFTYVLETIFECRNRV